MYRGLHEGVQFTTERKATVNQMIPLSVQATPQGREDFVQTERTIYAQLALLSAHKQKAAAVLQYLIANMERGTEAIIVPQKVIAEALKISVRTVVSAIQTLEEGNWIESTRIGAGKERAYHINSRVAWNKGRDKMGTAKFRATVIADAADQPEAILQRHASLRDVTPLYGLPSVMTGGMDVDQDEAE